MNLEEFNIIIFITGIIAGCIVTLAFKSITNKSNKQTNTNSNTITMKSLQQELDNKQVMIDNFFTDSSEHLSSIEKRIADLRSSLSDNASQLSHVKISKSLIVSNEEVSELPSMMEPPRDYALKNAQEPGMLSDTFGLDDKDADLEPRRNM
ncbi:ZapG family protein [Marinomonas sp. IMCC 4694]|uniref:ZapG family protein n=1 Tax=Marinomonas sp. IMCC 4694 TaxID=2605432 RepID=UPI0011E75CDB|nr:DUF1043 family protein [Marinomonas sp. IMCC 4694]TYL48054.1 DUF1043 family protein [Marinomonas sp. IMCC 4694]